MVKMMWGWSGYGYNWIGGIVGMIVTLFVFAAMVALTVWAVTSFSSRRPRADEEEAILRRRLAAGEITEQEYKHLRQVLHGQV